MDLCEVAPAQEAANHQLLLKIEKNNEVLQVLNPCLPLHQVVNIKVYHPILRHKNKAEHVLLCGVFDVMLLKAAVFNK